MPYHRQNAGILPVPSSTRGYSIPSREYVAAPSPSRGYSTLSPSHANRTVANTRVFIYRRQHAGTVLCRRHHARTVPAPMCGYLPCRHQHSAYIRVTNMCRVSGGAQLTIVVGWARGATMVFNRDSSLWRGGGGADPEKWRRQSVLFIFSSLSHHMIIISCYHMIIISCVSTTNSIPTRFCGVVGTERILEQYPLGHVPGGEAK